MRLTAPKGNLSFPGNKPSHKMRNSRFGERPHLKGMGWEMMGQGSQWSPVASACVHMSMWPLKKPC